MVEITFLALAFVCLLISFILSEVLLKLKYPRAIGQILTGIILTIPFFSFAFKGNNLSTLEFLSNLGVIFLLLLTGLRLNLKKFMETEKDAILISIAGFLLTFTMGFLVMYLGGYGIAAGLIVGACISLTAEGTKIEVLFDLKALNTKVGNILIGAGVFDDIIEIFFLSSSIIILGEGMRGLIKIPLKLILFIAIIVLIIKALPLLLKILEKDNLRFTTFSLVILVGLFIALLSAKLDFSLVLGALIAGIILNMTEKNRKEKKSHIEELELVTFSMIIPFFFINIGINFDFLSIISNLPQTLVILAVAIIGKIGGAILVTPFTKLSYKQTHLIGWAMNSRGLVELILASVALKGGLIDISIYSAIIAVAIISTIAFPVALKLLSKDRRIWY